ncbi:TetR/AcrR family transcriptional regulator [Agromyces salentinus]|uniref:Helix-turn-helix domain-containing protein n=1 Tax=Agromyces salentinus TaxID=269421 RepID=A0ABN2MRH2_9MICO|nr:TetR/AcrR family transcriptional regulator [Agromyces salentinus]
MPRPLIPDRRERILDAAERLVLERGFDAMSIASVASAAGIGKGAVYLEFASKRELLDAVLRRGTRRLRTRVDREIGPRPRLGAAYRAAIRALLDDELMTAAFLDDRGVLGTHVGTVDDDRYRRRQDEVVAWLRELQRSGRLAGSVDAEHLGLALSSATIGLLSAGRLLGPLSRAQLAGAIDTVAHMAASLETDTVD